MARPFDPTLGSNGTVTATLSRFQQTGIPWVTQARLAEETGLPRQTVADALARLLEAGLVRPWAETAGASELAAGAGPAWRLTAEGFAAIRRPEDEAKRRAREAAQEDLLARRDAPAGTRCPVCTALTHGARDGKRSCSICDWTGRV